MTMAQKSPSSLLTPTPLHVRWLDTLMVDVLPAVIRLPSPEGNPGDDDRGIDHPLARVTLSDLESHLELLTAQIAADKKRHQALQELRDLAQARGATAESLVLADFTVPLHSDMARTATSGQRTERFFLPPAEGL